MNPYNLCKAWQARISRIWIRKTASCAFLLAAVALLAYPVWRALAAGGNLDTSFSGDGRYTLPRVSPDPNAFKANSVRDVRIQMDPNNPQVEKVIAGYSDNVLVMPLGPHDFVVTRLHPSGVQDSTFGNNGLKFISFAGLGLTEGQGTVTALELQSNGKILVAGNLYENGVPVAGLARLTFDGALDLSFSNDGLWAYFAVAEVADMIVQSDGKIVLAGRWKPNSNAAWKSAIWRFNTNGSLDASFGSGGFFDATIWPGSEDDGRGFKSVYVQSDGKIVALSSNGDSYRLRRIKANGTLDITLQVNSVVGETGNMIRAVGSNLWIVGAKTQPGGKYGAIFARSSANGSVDTSFGNAGKVLSAQPSEWADVALMPFSFPAKYVIAGWNNYPPPPSSAVLNDKAVITRYSSTGILDTSFGTNGSTETVGFTLPNSGETYQQSRYFSVRIGLSGKIMTAGQTGPFNTWFPFLDYGVVARYWGN